MKINDMKLLVFTTVLILAFSLILCSCNNSAYEGSEKGTVIIGDCTVTILYGGFENTFNNGKPCKEFFVRVELDNTHSIVSHSLSGLGIEVYINSEYCGDSFYKVKPDVKDSVDFYSDTLLYGSDDTVFSEDYTVSIKYKGKTVTEKTIHIDDVGFQ